MHDLLAILLVREMLVAMGKTGDPIDSNHGAGLVELWIRMPNELLDGRPPLQVLSDEGGKEKVQAVLTRQLAAFD